MHQNRLKGSFCVFLISCCYYYGCLQHGTCPVCRKDLNGGDTTTTEFDREIGETIGSIQTDTEEGENPEQSGQNHSAQPQTSNNTTTSRPNRSDNTDSNSNNNAQNTPNRSSFRDDDVE